MKNSAKIILGIVSGVLLAGIVIIIILAVKGDFKENQDNTRQQGAKVSVKFFHTDITSRVDYIAPTYFGMKLIGVYLVEDINSTTLMNIGQQEMIYVNPDCNNNIGDCGISSYRGSFIGMISVELLMLLQPTSISLFQLKKLMRN